MTTFLDRLMGREPARKATTGGPWLAAFQQGPSLHAYGVDWQERAALFLQTYKVDWFYKAGARISRDFANLEWTLAYEDTEGDNEEEIVAPANNIPFDRLDPLEQFLRLSEQPNPNYSGRVLKARQMIRFMFTGRAIYYLEGAAGGGLPTALYGISPSRMWPVRNARNEITGWLLDKNSPSGRMPFTTDEILVVEEPGTEDDWPQGVVEAVYAQARISPMMATHTSDVLQMGGRLAGMAWPKERSLSEDEFADAQRAWRNVASDPNAARRLLLFPEPMEYNAGAATPKEIGVPELAELSRDDILTAFPISPYMIGVPMPGGLNSAETRKEERHDYWEGTIHPRVETFEDAFQQGLLRRYEEAVGRPLDFDIEEPNLDDAVSLKAKVDAFNALRDAGFEPKEAVAAVGLDHIKWEEPPEPEPIAPVPDPMLMQGPTVPPDDSSTVPAKAVKSRRQNAIDEARAFERSMRQFLDDQLERLTDEIEKELGPLTKAARKAVPQTWWDQEREDAALREHLRGLYLRLSRTALQSVADATERVVLKGAGARITEAMLDKAASRITNINVTTRDAVQESISEGVRRGYSINQIIAGVPDEAFAGVRDAKAANGLPVFDEARAELVARTETMLAYNESALRGYSEFGVERVEAIDGDDDPECAERNGQTFTVEEALAIEDHPNGTLDWIPL